MRDELDILLTELGDDIDRAKEKTKAVVFPVDFYPPKEQKLIEILHDSKGLSKQHVGLSMLPIFSRIYNTYTARAFNGAFNTVPIFWVGIVDQASSNKSESVKSWYNELATFNNFDDAENPRIFTSNDTTTEGLVKNMGDREDGIYLFSDEITSFTGGIGQYKRRDDSDKGFWLSMWSGGASTSLRVTGGIRHMKPQPISICGTTQPETLRNAFSKDMDNGFFHRFLWSVETNKIPKVPKNPDYEIAERLNLRIKEHMQYPRFNQRIKYSEDARDYLIEWHDAIVDRINNDNVERQFFGKDIIYVNRFALMTSVLHNNGDSTPISLASAKRAVSLYNFCKAMRQRAYTIVTEDDSKSLYEDMTLPQLARAILIIKPNANKSKLAETLGISRQSIYN
jgi:hypothetical protein